MSERLITQEIREWAKSPASPHKVVARYEVGNQLGEFDRCAIKLAQQIAERGEFDYRIQTRNGTTRHILEVL